jgi:hypothetical protein
MSVIPFPLRAHRALIVEQAARPAGAYFARFVGAKPYDGPTRTEAGTLELVLRAIIKGEARRGLPIILRDDGRDARAAAWAKAAGICVIAAHDSRWVSCDDHGPYGGGTAA